MRLENERRSENIEDRRGQGSRRGGFGAGRLGLGTIAVAFVASYLLGVNPTTVLSLLAGLDGGTQEAAPPAAAPPVDDAMATFVSKILADTEDTWHAFFAKSGRQYEEPKLVLFTGATPTACGTGQTAMGPFYCPGDRNVYIDLAFFQELEDRFHAGGEFAEAYVIAHEVGHHVQNLLGIADKVHRAKQHSGDQTEANALSVRMELQADCYAGVWGHRADTMKKLLEPGEIEQALNAATAIGDDRLQEQSRGYAVPESFTHGSSEQRVRWFTRGFESGNPAECDTFRAARI